MTKMQDDDKMPRPSLVREYFKTEPRRLGVVLLVLVGVVVAVTVPYIALVGFDEWSSNMKEASHMLWASYTPAAATLAPAMTSPPAGRPGPGEDRAPLTPLTPLPSPGRTYVCSGCGSTSLPVWGPNGTPHCPICSRLMSVSPNRGGEAAHPSRPRLPSQRGTLSLP